MKPRIPGQHTTAVLNYYQVPFGEEDERVPREINLHDAEFTSRRSVMTDIRGQEQEWKLLDNGVQIVKTTSSESDSELEDQVRNAAGGRNVITYQSQTLDENAFKMPGTVSPLIQIDNTVNGAKDTIFDLFTEKGHEMISDGYLMVDAWRPVRDCQRSSLAFVDSSPRHASRIDEDLIPVRQTNEKGADGQFYCLKHGDGWDGPDRHHWNFLNEQTCDEVVLLRVAENRNGMTRAAGTPRTLFDSPGSTNRVLAGWQRVRMIVQF
ncbi:hypothetical protein E6O75_ATG05600 [Venturia nashicola]|uniref:Uncharacterized protein n=1 Tax=Venturia nashicola TaxID=86259 RepID=A0A4Z1NZW9_9PEZI|nr:hypothetical protein E6O75_ATG05600 [Venturia nashicola]